MHKFNRIQIAIIPQLSNKFNGTLNTYLFILSKENMFIYFASTQNNPGFTDTSVIR